METGVSCSPFWMGFIIIFEVSAFLALCCHSNSHQQTAENDS